MHRELTIDGETDDAHNSFAVNLKNFYLRNLGHEQVLLIWSQKVSDLQRKYRRTVDVSFSSVPQANARRAAGRERSSYLRVRRLRWFVRGDNIIVHDVLAATLRLSVGS